MSKKKILITFVDSFSIVDHLKKEFTELSIDVDVYITNNSGHWLHRYFFKRINKLAKAFGLLPTHIDLFWWCPFSFEKFRDREFALRIEKFKPDLIFCIHGQQFGETILNVTKITKIGWYVEPNPDYNELIRHARLFDLYLSYDSRSVELLNGLNIRSEYQSHVASPSDFYVIPGSTKEIDVLLYGAWSPWREAVLFAAYQATKNIALYGNGWFKNCTIFSKKDLLSIHRGKEIIGSDLNQVINKSHIVLNAQRLKKSTTGLDTRAFDVLASGALLLTDAPTDLFRHFRDKEDLLVYEDSEELPKLIKYILEGGVEIDKIRRTGREKVLQGLTYRDLCQKISQKFLTD
ncbi:glycosyltransferase family protein [Polynucleobacter antarcticus]|uniref:Spore protein YkvP/CgeB glycosyl transferase-like domain-containing protein n=1 Tax=Polynucleobacter antarcticus TaxID=1743162 RepID=A0A6M9PIA9_9BURK|nr:glycosyltransferase [Polynucleobacter antarcticus]QKM61884.1 hypothetical protein DCO16_01570 [Polynucleobacter antarcticus]